MRVSTRLDGNVLADCSLENLNYQVDPYVGCGHYCYYCYVLNQAETDWTEEVLAYDDIEDRLQNELSEIPPQTIYMGWRTDPYQPCEAEHKQTRWVLELLLEKGFSASILTKSDLVLRDADLLKRMPDANVSVSVAFTDDDVRRLFEYDTMDTGKRIAALKRLQSDGIRTSALICPIMPHITDAVELMKGLEQHTDKIWLFGLSILNDSEINWRNIKRIFEEHYSELKDDIEAAVFSKDHPYWSELREKLTAIEKTSATNISIHF